MSTVTTPGSPVGTSSVASWLSSRESGMKWPVRAPMRSVSSAREPWR